MCTRCPFPLSFNLCQMICPPWFYHSTLCVLLSWPSPPACAHLRSMWNVSDVISFLRSWGLIAGLSLCQLAHHTMTLVLMFSCHHISNLQLVGRLPPMCVISQDQVVLQCTFGCYDGLLMSSSAQFGIFRHISNLLMILALQTCYFSQ